MQGSEFATTLKARTRRTARARTDPARGDFRNLRGLLTVAIAYPFESHKDRLRYRCGRWCGLPSCCMIAKSTHADESAHRRLTDSVAGGHAARKQAVRL
jgi:hypothetical protein